MSATTTLVEKATTLEQEAIDGQLQDSTNTNLRYAAYLARLKPIFIKSTRYLAYTSDVGEAFRPIVNPTFVKGAYAVSWLYLGGDVAYEGYKSHVRRQKSPLLDGPNEATEVGLVMTKRAIFQATASMLFPALTIHSAVRYSPPLFKNVKSPKIKGWGPTVVGLGIVPFLPFIFDEPIEHIVDAVFSRIENAVGIKGVESVREDIPLPPGKKEL